MPSFLRRFFHLPESLQKFVQKIRGQLLPQRGQGCRFPPSGAAMGGF